MLFACLHLMIMPVDLTWKCSLLDSYRLAPNTHKVVATRKGQP
jgi:hypothetical protein